MLTHLLVFLLRTNERTGDATFLWTAKERKSFEKNFIMEVKRAGSFTATATAPTACHPPLYSVFHFLLYALRILWCVRYNEQTDKAILSSSSFPFKGKKEKEKEKENSMPAGHLPRRVRVIWHHWTRHCVYIEKRPRLGLYAVYIDIYEMKWLNPHTTSFSYFFVTSGIGTIFHREIQHTCNFTRADSIKYCKTITYVL